jgi:hypothetical protein
MLLTSGKQQDLKNSGAPPRQQPPARGAPVLLRYKRYPNLRRVMRKPRRKPAIKSLMSR